MLEIAATAGTIGWDVPTCGTYLKLSCGENRQQLEKRENTNRLQSVERKHVNCMGPASTNIELCYSADRSLYTAEHGELADDRRPMLFIVLFVIAIRVEVR